jgi:hypothetical protein
MGVGRMSQQRNSSSEKLTRITETANRFARQMGGTFVENPEKRAAFEARERTFESRDNRSRT